MSCGPEQASACSWASAFSSLGDGEVPPGRNGTPDLGLGHDGVLGAEPTGQGASLASTTPLSIGLSLHVTQGDGSEEQGGHQVP